MRFGWKQNNASTVTKSAPAAQPPAPSAPAAPNHEAQVNLLLDTLTTFLQLYGRHGFDTEARSAKESHDIVNQWSRHASVGTPAPGQPDNGKFAAITQRHWKGLIQFFSEHRRGESQYVTTAVRDLRETVWTCLGAINQTVHDEHDAERQTGEQLDRVRAAVSTGSVEQLKREALATIDVFAAVSERRRSRQTEQLSALADKLRTLSFELEEARRESTTDPLTELANRRAFDAFVTRSVALHTITGKPASLLMVDLDNFKEINDARGHQAGDDALRAVANTLARVFMRRCDFVCRYGGDEFVVLLHETPRDGAEALALRLQESVRTIEHVDGEPGIRLSVSIGIAELARDDTPDTWLRRADFALYAAKESGQGQIGLR
jgi:diguanylate cyclase